jgi:hypothetical protein
MRLSCGHLSRISSSLSTCSWSSAKAKLTSALLMGNTHSAAAASWYSGIGTAPSDCTASMVAYRRGRLAPTTTMWSSRRRPAWCRPAASSCTMLARACQLRVCQMPYSFSRMAGACGRWAAWCSSSCGKVVRIGFLLLPNADAAGYSNGLIIGPALTLSCHSDDNRAASW